MQIVLLHVKTSCNPDEKVNEIPEFPVVSS